MVKCKVVVFSFVLLAFTTPAVSAASKKPIAKWTCGDFLALKDQFKPKAVYETTILSRGGKPEDLVFDPEDTEKVVRTVVKDCQKVPAATFWTRLKAAWRGVESDVKKL